MLRVRLKYRAPESEIRFHYEYELSPKVEISNHGEIIWDIGDRKFERKGNKKGDVRLSPISPTTAPICHFYPPQQIFRKPKSKDNPPAQCRTTPSTFPNF